VVKMTEKTIRKRAVRQANPHSGSSFDDFLAEEGMLEEVHAKALKRALAEQLQESMAAANLTKIKMAEKMATSRSQLDRVLDPNNTSVQLDTLIKAARAVGATVDIAIVYDAKPKAGRMLHEERAAYSVSKKKAGK
jgi:antitoxin HicB